MSEASFCDLIVRSSRAKRELFRTRSVRIGAFQGIGAIALPLVEPGPTSFLLLNDDA
jgi:hypothetical protein